MPSLLSLIFDLCMHLRTFTLAHPLLNFLNGGRITAFSLMIQCRPTRTLAKSPLTTAPL